MFGPVGADIVVLTANPWSAYRLSMEIVRYGGRVSILGFPGRAQEPPEFNPLDVHWIYAKQSNIDRSGVCARVDRRLAEIRLRYPP